MTLLHQAAQKAVEQLKRLTDGRGGIAHFARTTEQAGTVRELIAALESALQQQPEPVAAIGWLYDWTHSSALGKPDEQFTSFTTDEAHARKHDNPRLVYTAPPALQHQEVPREPVAWLNPSSGKTCSADEKFSMENHQGMPGKAVAAHFSDPLYASPSTTRQQEVGSAEAWDFTCWRRELVYLIENHYDASDAAKHRTMEAITEHVDAAGMHWRAVTALRDIERRAAAPSTPENAGGVIASDGGQKP